MARGYAEQPEVTPRITFKVEHTQSPESYAQLWEAIKPAREELLNHRVYSLLTSKRAIQIFMEHHCYAVMDFMCLLKSLQQRLTVLSIPWFPPANADAARFINEIVLGEESDVAPGGGYISHYQLYVRAMKEAGADPEKVEMLVELGRNHQHYRRALVRAGVPAAAQAFVSDSISVCLTGKNHEIAAYFLFGRENLIPEMFPVIVERLQKAGVSGLDGLAYYLNRHIEVDGGEHGPAAEKMLNYLVDGSPRRWAEAHETALRALQSRAKLWDAIALALDNEAGDAKPAGQHGA